MRLLPELFKSNRDWADAMKETDPDFFAKLCGQQTPEYLWIGCSDSRVPANQIVGLLPGELFVHRNVANQVIHTDLNCLSVMQYAVDVLKIKHIIVCGHYGCGGVQAALRGDKLGLIDNWLRHVQNVKRKHSNQLISIIDETTRFDRLCELNIIEQVYNVCLTTIVQDAWARGQSLSIHGWVYKLTDGRLKDLKMGTSQANELEENYRAAIA